jgi:hypothetical protein
MEVRKENCISLYRDTILYDTYHLSLPAAITCHMCGSSADYTNPLASSDPYMGRTAQLTSRRCILNTVVSGL